MFDLDKNSIRLLKQQDHGAFNTFYLQSVDYFFRYVQANYFISEEDTNDIIADFYMKRWDAVKKYDEKYPFSSYVWTIFKNTVKDYLKKHTDIPFTNLDNKEDDTTFADTLVDDVDMTELLESDFAFEKIQIALQRLSDSDRDIIHMKFIEEKSTEEIVDILGIPNSTIRKRLSRAMQNLKSLLEES